MKFFLQKPKNESFKSFCCSLDGQSQLFQLFSQRADKCHLLPATKIRHCDSILCQIKFGCTVWELHNTCAANDVGLIKTAFFKRNTQRTAFGRDLVVPTQLTCLGCSSPLAYIRTPVQTIFFRDLINYGADGIVGA